jgi:hypothetical protein
MALTSYFEPVGNIKTGGAAIDNRLARILNGQLRWACNTYRIPTSYPAASEYPVRGAGSVACALATTVQMQVYDAALSHVASYTTPNNRSVALITGPVNGHRVFTGAGWGAQWQSGLWAGLVGTAGWVQWRYLTGTDRQRLLQVMEYEADQRLAQPPRYLRDAAGHVLTPGDTGAEENAWNSIIVALASVMMPGHPHAAAWRGHAVRLAVASYAHPDDVTSDVVVSGRAVREWLAGSNTERDWTVVNHGKVNPDYMQSAVLLAHTAAVFALAGRPVPEGVLWNLDRIYGRLTDFYLPGEPPRPVTYPQGPDWGNRRSPGWWIFDTAAAVLGFGQRATRTAGYWADVHLADVDAMQQRYPDGHLVADNTEDSYPAREQSYAFQMALGWMLHWLAAHGRLTMTDAAVPDG